MRFTHSSVCKYATEDENHVSVMQREKKLSLPLLNNPFQHTGGHQWPYEMKACGVRFRQGTEADGLFHYSAFIV